MAVPRIENALIQRRPLLAAALGATCAGAWGQSYPSRPVKLVVPFGAGTTTDIVARAVAVGLGQGLGQSIVVENRAGGGGGIGCALVAKAPADGYTVLMGTASTHGINPSLYRSLAYDVEKDFVPIGFAGYTSNLLAVPASSPFKSLDDLKAAAAKSGGITFASAGSGTTGHLCAELLKMHLGGEMVHAPYKEGNQALTDLMSGQVGFMFYHPAAVMPHVASGRLRVLGISSAKRSTVVPTAVPIAEQGYPDFDLVSWFMLYAPAACPPDVVARLRGEFAAAHSGSAQKLSAQGIEARVMDGPAMVAFNKAELAKWSAIVKRSGATAD